MKIETLVDVINYERGEWQGCSGSNCVEIGPRSGRSLYGAVTFESLCVKVNSKAFKAIPSKFWSREEFEKEVAELSAAPWIEDIPSLCSQQITGKQFQDMFSMVPPQQKKSDQVHQPESSGGSCSYYKCEITSPTTEPEAYTAECNDLIEALDMTYAEANMFKEIWRTCAARKGKVKEGHQSTRGAEKVLFFAVRNAIQKDADVSQIISDINKG